jgi:hypothetical protein
MMPWLLGAIAQLPAVTRLDYAQHDSEGDQSYDAAVGGAMRALRAPNLEGVALDEGRAASFLARLTALTVCQCSISEASQIGPLKAMLLALPCLVSLNLAGNASAPSFGQGPAAGTGFAAALAPALRS